MVTENPWGRVRVNPDRFGLGSFGSLEIIGSRSYSSPLQLMAAVQLLDAPWDTFFAACVGLEEIRNPVRGEEGRGIT